MAELSAREVQELRQAAGVGMMDAKKALVETGGDYEAALELLGERGLAQAANRADRQASEGTIGFYLHVQNDRPVMGVLVDLACETDFVAKSDEFKVTANDIAMHASWGRPLWITREDVSDESLGQEREGISRQAEAEGKPAHVIDQIVAGRLDKFYRENVLYEQDFVNPEKFEGTVGEMVSRLATKMGEKITVRRMARVAVGDTEQ